MKKDMDWLGQLAFWLVFIGAVNWGLVGAFEFNLVDAILGSWPVVERVVYVVVGLAGLYTLVPCCTGKK